MRQTLAAVFAATAVVACGAPPAHSLPPAVISGTDLAALVETNLLATRAAMDELRACAGCPAASLQAETVALRAMKAISRRGSQGRSASDERGRVVAFEGFRSYGESAFSYGESRYYSDLGKIEAALLHMRTAHRQLEKARTYARQASSLLKIRISRLP